MDILPENGKGDIHRIGARLILEFEDEEKAERILRSLEVDNYQYIKCHREGRRIVCESSSDKPSSLLHTLDDFIACVIVSDEVYRST